MTVEQRMERQFFINMISLVKEVQGHSKLPSQVNSSHKSTWCKQVKNPRQKKDALALV
jgi:hypothetical protein